MTIDVSKELNDLGYEFESKGSSKVYEAKFSSITDANPTDISFCYYDGDKAINYISRSNAGIILCKNSIRDKINPKDGQCLYFLENPRLAFVQLFHKYNDTKDVRQISQCAILHESAKVGKDCTIGAYSVVDKDCIVGDNCIIGNRVSLRNCVIGNNCIIQSGTVIGEDGFAYERYENNELLQFPHIGKVIIGDNVEICANCSIARGSLSNTIIDDGTKLDALVHIAHNVKIGKNCELTAGTVIGGSTVVGNSTWTGLNSTLKDNIRVGNNVIVGAGAMVIKDVEDKDIVAGVPAKSIKNKTSTNLTFLMAGQKD
ncbi:UDP-3-O-(3-hydroxymyristoyl)glucosamine N-acyltransferase [Candidatus Nitrosocosmicus franklandus]|uniref:UDP-3-O- 3-hydroxymyristoyl glucosamine N-acyltransferase n=1 Tax=Candidatus Nitrosocosmicus franklandianus TaxID=1798806 RepID=A0A484I7G5_9ARCH|nr:UDP-3-O-(3-hydroxymyristoyl)glucosamine N-acyltransferase [Candidatus Nitrosocosmicus franklandus]VFJ13111.1 UDP-3-O- 3-hydroxymyristoyl glucosamine N-acyltransferase [Candidatus Nitrosocosmicus franklandus]